MTHIEAEIAQHPAMVLWALGGLGTAVLALVVLVVRLVWPSINSKDRVRKNDCRKHRIKIDQALSTGHATHRLFRRTLLVELSLFRVLCDQLLVGSDAAEECRKLCSLIEELQEWPNESPDANTGRT